MKLPSPEEKIKKNGAVYTPTNLANFVASKLIRYYSESIGFYSQKFANWNKDQNTLSELKILDPACGDGELLISSWLAIEPILKKSQSLSNTKITNPQDVLYGIDIDIEAVKIAKKRIRKSLNLKCNLNKLKIIKTNALFPLNREERESGWNLFYSKNNINGGFDLIIANPPWGADTSEYKKKFQNNEFVLYKGQYDSSDLFIELALNITKQNGFFAFIISDSLFNEERTKLRQMLLETTEVKFIGRFGEKIFDNINRACAVIICKNCKPNEEHKIDCLRLNPKIKKEIFEGNKSFFEADRLLSHRVKQTRFLKNTSYIFDIDLKVNEELVLEKFSNALRLGDFLYSSRGIELSKYGKINQCPKCKLWSPRPRSTTPKCSHCGMPLIENESQRELIIKNKNTNGYKPIFIGESICRYKLLPNKWIDVSKEGIKYKSFSIYSGPKLLVRKTGVGILSMIDTSDSFTNQVVYIFKLKEIAQTEYPLELFLAILNSRAIYFYLVKRYGETEWRSHPYLTQTQILNLPIPNPQKLTIEQKVNIEIIRRKIAMLLRGKKTFTKNLDVEIERLVAKVFNLDKEDYSIIYNTINSVQNLLPIQELKKITCKEIFSE